MRTISGTGTEPKGLSRMTGNSHLRFSVGGRPARVSRYPTTAVDNLSRFFHVEASACQARSMTARAAGDRSRAVVAWFRFA